MEDEPIFYPYGVMVVSETIQEFLGTRYYLCDRYFQANGVRLHRVVNEHFHGPIPDDHDVHHKDEDRSNNQPENLQRKLSVDHQRDHAAERGFGMDPEHLDRIHAAAAEWHGSEKGRQWHSEHYESVIRPAMEEKVVKVCEECKSEYEVSKHAASRSRFCHPNCKMRARTRRLRELAA